MSLNDFSWNRVRKALRKIEKCDYYITSHGLVINFLYHKQSVLLNTSGFGILYHPYNENSRPAYNFIMPHDVQEQVKEIWDLYAKPIPFNAGAN